MRSNRTKLGLSQWELHNKPDMDDFNEDNLIIDKELQNRYTIEEVNAQLSKKVSITDDTGWQTLTLMNGAVAGPYKGVPRYRKVGKFVQVIGSVANIDSAPFTIANLPSNCRPITRIDSIQAVSFNRHARIYVSSNGNIIVECISDNVWNNEYWFALDFCFFVG